MVSSKIPARAFTLYELLAVVAILGVLIVLVAPVASRLQRQGMEVKCLSNIRTYGNAVLTMMADRGGLPEWDGLGSSASETGVPQFNKWLTTGGYLPVEPALRCPLGDSPQMQNVTPRYRFPYAGNMSLCATFPKAFAVPAPLHRVVLAAEVNDWDGFTSATNLNSTIWNGGTPGNDGQQRPLTRYHGTPTQRGLHFFFLDGSASLVFPTDNNWNLEPVRAPITGTASQGYFYHRTHFENLKNGRLVAQ